MTKLSSHIYRWLIAGFAFASGAVLFFGAVPTAEDIQALIGQNQQLQQRVEQQQKQIDELRGRIDQLQGTPNASAPEIRERSPGEIRLSGEAGVAFFRTGRDGTWPNSEFRIDDAKLFVETPVWKNVYFFGGIELTSREVTDEYFHVGELYLDAENVLSSGRDMTLSVRAGRMNIPFGEEYLVRNMLDNPLVTHSLPDVWGIDEGVQVYGRLGRISYNLAVQNGGHRTMRDFDPDKSVTARLSYDPTSQLHLSFSGHRTGKLAAAQTTGDYLSEIWLGNGFFRALGSAGTTRTFAAELMQVDARWKWKSGHVLGLVGWADFDDDSSAGDNSRHMHYYSIEGVQTLAGGLYAAARFSRIDAPRGYPLVGQGGAFKYFYNAAAPLTTDLQRLSVGLGYRFAAPLIWKLEYNWETGRLAGGAKRNDEDLLATLLAVKF